MSKPREFWIHAVSFAKTDIKLNQLKTQVELVHVREVTDREERLEQAVKMLREGFHRIEQSIYSNAEFARADASETLKAVEELLEGK